MESRHGTQEVNRRPRVAAWWRVSLPSGGAGKRCYCLEIVPKARSRHSVVLCTGLLPDVNVMFDQ
ncbi:hypothetical protein E2C01_017493 [Portunus trituberculatus]|uniref:Uncharacterized protein n=1 Tax=Portunus trituberculatus TaxID=210409 RepID=A0A5B7DRV7_PORTR|nr:hypothetical protein [Portunus trituberculatus]